MRNFNPSRFANRLADIIQIDFPILNNLNQEDVVVALTDEEFNNLEKIKYDETNEEHKKNISICNICLEKIIHDDSCIKLKCNHYFHSNCIESWLKEHSNKCPVCREEVSKGEPKNL